MRKNLGKITFITMGVRLPGETMGYTRFDSLARTFAEYGYEVELVTTVFQHWEKRRRNVDELNTESLPYKVSFIDEPGYKRNVDPLRIYSHHIAARNLSRHLDANGPYQAIYAEVPPNDVARAAGEFARANSIPFIIDVNDLWPEAMKMVFDLRPISTLLYWPMTRDARAVYRMADAVIGTSDEYRERPYKDGSTAAEKLTVYVGNELDNFDSATTSPDDCIQSLAHKPDSTIWLTYAGTLGESYDIGNLINAVAELKKRDLDNIQLVLAGDGPNRAELEQQAVQLQLDVQFVGFLEYAQMAKLLVRSDILINSFAPKAPQSIVNKIADYLAAGKPIINTGASPELCSLLNGNNAGINVNPGDPAALADAISTLIQNNELRKTMGASGRLLAQQRFNRQETYPTIVEMVNRLL